MRLQSGLRETVRSELSRALLLIGDAWTGKSALLTSVYHWLDSTASPPVYFFQGQATPLTRDRPFGVMGNLIAYRAHLRASDEPEVIREKLRVTLAVFLTGSDLESVTVLVGTLYGLRADGHPAVRDVADSPPLFRRRLEEALATLGAGVRRTGPSSLLIDDLHHADEASLKVLEHWVTMDSDSPICLIASARRLLLERRATWAHLTPASEVLELEASPERPDREVSAEPESPDDFDRDWERLTDSQRTVLSRAAVFGETFWSAGVESLAAVDGQPVDGRTTLQQLTEAGLVRPFAESTFERSTEYRFDSPTRALDAQQRTDADVRQAYHLAAAQWLLRAAGAVTDSVSQAVAVHLAQGNALTESSRYYIELAKHAFAFGAPREALAWAEQARYLLATESGRYEDLDLELVLGKIYAELGDPGSAEAHLTRAKNLAVQLGDRRLWVESIVLFGKSLQLRGEASTAHTHLLPAIEAARALKDPGLLMLALRVHGNLLLDLERHQAAEEAIRESLALAEQLKATEAIAACLNSLGAIAEQRREYERALEYFRQALDLAIQIGNAFAEAALSANLAHLLYELKPDQPEVRIYAERGLQASAAIKNIYVRAVALEVLGLLDLDAHRPGEARDKLHAALADMVALRSLPGTMSLVAALSRWAAETNEGALAARFASMALRNPASEQRIASTAERTLRQLAVTGWAEAVARELQAAPARDVLRVAQDYLEGRIDVR